MEYVAAYTGTWASGCRAPGEGPGVAGSSQRFPFSARAPSRAREKRKGGKKAVVSHGEDRGDACLPSFLLPSRKGKTRSRRLPITRGKVYTTNIFVPGGDEDKGKETGNGSIVIQITVRGTLERLERFPVLKTVRAYNKHLSPFS